MIRDWMNKDVVTCEASHTVVDVARLMNSKNVGCVLVMQNHQPIGMVTDRDIALKGVAAGRDLKQTPVGTITSKTLVSCKETDGFNDCIQIMRNSKVRRVAVLNDQNQPVGLISFADIASILGQELFDLSESLRGKGPARSLKLGSSA